MGFTCGISRVLPCYTPWVFALLVVRFGDVTGRRVCVFGGDCMERLPIPFQYLAKNNWLVVWNVFDFPIFSHLLGIIISTYLNWPIFLGGVETTNKFLLAKEMRKDWRRWSTIARQDCEMRCTSEKSYGLDDEQTMATHDRKRQKDTGMFENARNDILKPHEDSESWKWLSLVVIPFDSPDEMVRSDRTCVSVCSWN